MSLFTEYEFSKCVNRYKGDRHAIKFNCRDQFLVMSFAQFTDRNGLRDIETTLRERWQIGIFFKCIKQHLHIKSFYGTTMNAVFTQIWIAICNYLLLILAKKQYGLNPSLHLISNSIGQILFKRGEILDFYNKPEVPLDVPEEGSARQLTFGKISPDSNAF